MKNIPKISFAGADEEGRQKGWARASQPRVSIGMTFMTHRECFTIGRVAGPEFDESRNSASLVVFLRIQPGWLRSSRPTLPSERMMPNSMREGSVLPVVVDWSMTIPRSTKPVGGSRGAGVGIGHMTTRTTGHHVREDAPSTYMDVKRSRERSI